MTSLPLVWVLSVPSWSFAAQIEVNLGFLDMGGPIIQKEIQSSQEIKQKNVVIQERDYSCGTASLSTLLKYYLGKSVDETEIIKTLLRINEKRGTLEEIIKRRGFSLLDLKLFAEDQGFKATGFRLDFDDLVNLHKPALVPIIPDGFKHFVVFRGSDGQRVFLADPSFGNLIESVEQFKKDWYGFTNVALIVVPKDDQPIEQHALTVTELDKIYAGQESVDSIRFNPVSPSRPFIPGEF
jgi:predicted double-glycine peptidase